MMQQEIAKQIVDYFEKYSTEKGYNSIQSSHKDFLRIDVSNGLDKININIYHTGKSVVGGIKSKLKQEFEDLKNRLIESPELIGGARSANAKSCANRYNILLPDTRSKIKDALAGIEGAINYYENPTPSEEYRAKLTTGQFGLSITQYKNGTLFLQGKEDTLFDKTCDLIEGIALPSGQEVIVRFISANEEALAAFSSSFTPKLLELAERKVIDSVGSLYSFLEPHDQKWLVASESLRMVNLPLPEFSPIVMPASKSFEGFIKKLLVEVGFFPAGHFSSKTATFDYLNNPTHPSRQAFVSKEKYADTYLKKINVCLDTNRNFMLHSDGNTVTQITNYEAASEKLDQLVKDMVDIFEYFQKPEFGLTI